MFISFNKAQDLFFEEYGYINHCDLHRFVAKLVGNEEAKVETQFDGFIIEEAS